MGHMYGAFHSQFQEAEKDIPCKVSGSGALHREVSAQEIHHVGLLAQINAYERPPCQQRAPFQNPHVYICSQTLYDDSAFNGTGRNGNITSSLPIAELRL